MLGQKTEYKFDQPSQKILQKVANPHLDVDYAIRFSCPEFTSVCPITSQPDFAHLVIDYVPSNSIVSGIFKNTFLRDLPHSYRPILHPSLSQQRQQG